MAKTTTTLTHLYQRMARHYGPTHWWPGDSPFEIAIGAILTQNTAWTNVERAIQNLKDQNLLSPQAILDAETPALEIALRASGYFRQKTKRLRIFSKHLMTHYDGKMVTMAKRPLEELREELLTLHGIGSETADDILLYACDHPVFVVDAYTRRILSRHGIVAPDIKYEALRATFEDHLSHDLHTFREFHGLIVFTAKDFCKTKPNCNGCPLVSLLKKGQPKLYPIASRSTSC